LQWPSQTVEDLRQGKPLLMPADTMANKVKNNALPGSPDPATWRQRWMTRTPLLGAPKIHNGCGFPEPGIVGRCVQDVREWVADARGCTRRQECFQLPCSCCSLRMGLRMGPSLQLSDLFTPAWRSAPGEVRLAAPMNAQVNDCGRDKGTPSSPEV
jgi:hypothetical protein